MAVFLLLLATLLPKLIFTAHIDVGIVNGMEAKPHSRPYMVSLQVLLDNTWEHNCGGFLISDQFVLTAAHCHIRQMTVVVGVHDLKSTKEGSVRIKLMSYHLHPDYMIDPLMNDIMLLRLQSKVKQNKNINWISIPTKDVNNKADSDCSVAGWGKLSNNGPGSTRLMEVDVKIMDNTKCKNKWGEEYSASQMMCVYGNGASCEGDSGGPLVCGDTAVGITSFGSKFGCNSHEYPEVYTKISAYLPWIHNITGNNSTSSEKPSQSIMIISLLLLGSLLPYLTLTAYVNVGIVNGTEAKPHSRPYMVSLQYNEKHTCGGFLLSKEFVMTAAHCFKERQTMTVMIGAHDCNSGSSSMAVKFYHIHPGYDAKTLLNDIMLLQLSGKAKQSKNVNWISIPGKDGDIKANSECSVAGWGTNSTNGRTSNHLMEVDVTIKDKKTCKKFWGQTYSTSRMVCAGGHGGFCQGDSGGPLVCGGKAVGVVSFNELKNCNFPKKPNVYTKISKFLTWINAILGSLKQELDYY
ncbi:transmembrane protease serine 9-like [Xyrauchen texanus]|uniref:transmembrane protease serine 9-like n=1 Tax=Xyrauchen texanus TaxID=154827 RepID=UPI002241DDAD|nr:transmembrane protease serine 9-like [Xyrauchen texanus]